MAKPIKVTIRTDDGVTRIWRGEDAAKWGAYMVRTHGTEQMPTPTVVVNTNNEVTYRKARAARRAKMYPSLSGDSTHIAKLREQPPKP